ncbi:shikimate kinase, chloroplastic [Alnus glutinosa]|uniref:shikimate kinase, chloroplastic n=1 Tax=Alnus glutinosa TaxID=3517 RepID=UPI002D770A6E|nr:shikimate kinase, chloroplastic [Alnus glutinosa]XP_062148024.1 shikimate kinase, chloroplastic [Alnus glutinosa]
MEAKVAQSLLLSPTGSEKIVRGPSGSVRFSRRFREQDRIHLLVSAQCQPKTSLSNRRKTVSCSYKNFPASILESGGLQASFDDALILKNKSQEIEPHLNGRCIYLVGMMGSGKTTVGKILSQVIGYSFSDSDTWVEEDLGGTSVSEVFKLYGEGFFREKETEALRKLSLMHRLVISTGGGAVVRPINWKYMQKGISVWLDVPVEALAHRISAVGTGSRPLLNHDSGDAYKKTYTRLSTLLEERIEAYANANARVSVEDIAAKLGHRDVCNLTPAAIAIEALEKIEGFLKEENGNFAF